MIVFCVTCKNRTQHLEQTLPKNLADNPGPLSKFVVLNYSSQDHLDNYLQTNHASAIENGKLAVYNFKELGPFRMAHAKNMAHRMGILEGGDLLVNLDADNFTGPQFDRYIASQFESAGPEAIFLWARMVKGDYARGISGRIVVTRNAFLKTGGYDEKFIGWASDDKDFNARLRRLGYEGREIAPQYLDAVRHSDKMRFRGCPQAKAKADEYGQVDMFSRDPSHTIVNYGRFGRGVVYRNFSERPIVLGDVPTRVFGVGMHRTATTSLHHALQILGFNSAHWKSAHWAKAIWEEMNATGKSPTMERSYALCDLPFTLLYRTLDITYPGSKFILTMRDEDRWIESVRSHWSDQNPFRAGWDTDPFTHRIHTELYGRKKFDEAVFRARYRRHNAEVRAYFHNRPSDLLVMNMGKPWMTEWAELCGFLRCPIPTVAYPKSFVTIGN